MKKIIILDLSTTSVHVFNYDSNIFDANVIVDFFDYINNNYEDINLKESQCSWMIVDTVDIKVY